MGSLLSLLLLTAPVEPAETRVTIDVKDADVVDVVRLFAEVAGAQVVVDPGVGCKVTLKLSEVAWRQAFDLSLKMCSLGSEEEGGVLRVAPVAKLTAEEADRRKLAEARELNRPREIHEYRLSYARAEQLVPLVKKFLSPGGEAFVDARTNTLFIID